MFGVDRHCSRKRERRSSEARLHYLNIYFHLLSTCNLLGKEKKQQFLLWLFKTSNYSRPTLI